MYTIKKWWLSARPYSLSASAIPVLFGASLALDQGRQDLNFTLLFLSLIAMLLLQAGANILNDIHDFRNGLDRVITPVSGGIVRGIITIRQAWVAVIILFSAGSGLGIFISFKTTPWLMLIGISGLLIGWFYSHGNKTSLKFRSLGDAAVFFSFGTLGALGSWMVQTRHFSWLPVLWSIPIALLIIAIVHANNWRDMKSDQAHGVHTVANLLGDTGSMRYYTFLIFSPFLIVLALITLPRFFNQTSFPLAGLLIIFCLPLALKLQNKASLRHRPAHPHDFIALDGATAQLNLVFGVLCTLSLIIDHLL